MTDLNTNSLSEAQLSRRAFVRGATCLAGVSMLGIATSAEASVKKTDEHAPGRDGSSLSLAYWDGTRMVDAARLGMGMGDGSLMGSSIRVTVNHHTGSHSTLLGLSALYPINNGSELAPYHAWAASEYGSSVGVFTMPIGEAAGLSLSIRHKSGGNHTDSDVLRLTAGTDAATPKLMTGTYVIASRPELSGCTLKTDESEASIVLHNGAPAKFDCLIVDVQRAFASQMVCPE